MPSVGLYSPALASAGHEPHVLNPLPTLLHTPSGLAILEIQGTIHAPPTESSGSDWRDADKQATYVQTPVGRLEFPLFASATDASDRKWTKKVYLYVGKHQRLTGEVKKLPKALVVVGRRSQETKDNERQESFAESQQNEELEILEVIRYKILFGGRPEPVGG